MLGVWELILSPLATAEWPHFPVYITRQIFPFWLSLM